MNLPVKDTDVMIEQNEAVDNGVIYLQMACTLEKGCAIELASPSKILYIRPTIKRSNSWSARESRTFNPFEDEYVTPKPQSSRTYQKRRNKSMCDSQNGAATMNPRGDEKEVFMARNGGTRTLTSDKYELSETENVGNLRRSFIKGAKGITKGTKQVIGKMKNKLKMPSRTEKMSMELLESCADLFETTGNSLDELSSTKIGHLSRASTLSRSLSLTDLMEHATSDEPPPETEKEAKSEHSQKMNPPRRKSRSRKDPLCASSEHIPRSSSNRVETFRKKDSSSKDMIRRTTSIVHQDRETALPAFQVALKDTENGSPTKVKKRRSRAVNESLTKSEHVPSQSKQVRRRPSLEFSSWAESTLGPDSDSEDEFGRGEKKAFNPHFSWDLSQLLDMENLLLEEADKEGTKNEKLKNAITNMKKRISGATKKSSSSKGSSKQGASHNDSSDNVFLFDDSYQNNFVFESIGSGIGDSKRENSREKIETDPTKVIERQNSSRSLKRRSSLGQQSSPFRARRLSGGINNDVTSPPQTPKTQRSGSSQRRRRSSGSSNKDGASPHQVPRTPRSSSTQRRRSSTGGSNSCGKKPSSFFWRELYSQQSPGQGVTTSASTTTSSTPRRPSRRSSRNNKIPTRHSSFEDIASPKAVQEIGMPSIDKGAGRHRSIESSRSEEFTCPTSSAAQKRQSRRPPPEEQPLKKGGSRTVRPGARDLELLQW